MLIPLFQAGKKSAECVKVIVRCRPMNEKEIAANHERFDKCVLVVSKSHAVCKLFTCC